MDSEIIEEYFEEIKSLLFEITTKDRNGHEYSYGVDSNFKPYDLFRLPKYNQDDKNFSYEIDLRRLKDKLVRFVKIEYDKEKGLRIVKLIEGEAIKNKKLYNFLNKYINQIEGTSEDFDYSYFIIESMGIITNLNPNQGIWSNGFLGSYGLITKEFIWDLQDAYMFKNSSLSSLKNELIDFYEIELEKEIEESYEENGWIKHCQFLKGVNHIKEKIMSDKEYETLIKHVSYLIKYDKVPTITKPQKAINLSNQHLIHTFYLIHKEMFTTLKIRDSFLVFLKKYFVQLSNISDIRTAFSKKPKNNRC